MEDSWGMGGEMVENENLMKCTPVYPHIFIANFPL